MEPTTTHLAVARTINDMLVANDMSLGQLFCALHLISNEGTRQPFPTLEELRGVIDGTRGTFCIQSEDGGLVTYEGCHVIPPIKPHLELVMESVEVSLCSRLDDEPTK